MVPIVKKRRRSQKNKTRKWKKRRGGQKNPEYLDPEHLVVGNTYRILYEVDMFPDYYTGNQIAVYTGNYDDYLIFQVQRNGSTQQVVLNRANVRVLENAEDFQYVLK
jgi:hypothetical protein